MSNILRAMKNQLKTGAITPKEVFDSLVIEYGYTEEEAIEITNRLSSGTSFTSDLTIGDMEMLESKTINDKENIIEIKKDVRVGNIILERGDKVQVLKEQILANYAGGASFEIYCDSEDSARDVYQLLKSDFPSFDMNIEANIVSIEGWDNREFIQFIKEEF
jgi:hypothetical protein